VYELAEAVQSDPPDWLFVQFNQFSYGRWGFNLFLPFTVWRIQQIAPDTRIAVMFHEDFVPVTSWKNAIMTTWQRGQFWMLGRLADHIFFSIAPWVEKYQSWFPGTPVHHLPVGSNMPLVEVKRDAIRRKLGFNDSTFVLGVFGSLHASRLLGHIRAAAEMVAHQNHDFSLLYIGPHGEAFQNVMGKFPVLNAGRLSAEDVSRYMQAMDVHLTPFIDGASTRRGSFMAGLQHGIPTVATQGPLTDDLLRNADGTAFYLAPVAHPDKFAKLVSALSQDASKRTTVGRAGQKFYNHHFSFDVVSKTLLHHLSSERAT
jgi:glycosyltransferase involved in cell wall biosynthesis